MKKFKVIFDFIFVIIVIIFVYQVFRCYRNNELKTDKINKLEQKRIKLENKIKALDTITDKLQDDLNVQIKKLQNVKQKKTPIFDFSHYSNDRLYRILTDKDSCQAVNFTEN